ncbi:hypothetical protein HH214_04780 [Mucilaginibacter robiniae]|uniref:Gylcosyl hydrolase 115 C-terminal domain-containing protein n=1 Tax=Mucilaginibacter robiniae TaxID=2728022 RepID=A0A7L5DYW8_9SPHI|nr:glycosyl hydrolase 115 family protein [Mucilaginibacter robiniae]QJD95239.1 hypothetical protein HH214_04780 [Mucilaginibacter robiniae]
MNDIKRLLWPTLVVLLLGSGMIKAEPFTIINAQTKVSIIYAVDDGKIDSIAAHLLAADIQRVSGYLPRVYTDVTKAQGQVIIIGSVHSALIRSLHDSYFDQLKGRWECYSLKVKAKPFKNITNALVIVGSDYRGTAYGVFDISSRIGVTPWYWWADVQPERKRTVLLNINPYTSQPPSVKYRGIFINDEDWGLQPWAAKTFEPETGDIGPKTYAKVFELLLRLRANLIWPAMHPSTKPFYYYPENLKVAEDYQIVIGSSHAEPMLRNNVGEWNEKTMGSFNYVTNQQKVDDYWASRVKESSHLNAIYTIGMRGVHDSGIEGVKTIAETVPLLERIMKNQRMMLKTYINPDIKQVPQAFTAYKEVLDVYDGGLQVPEDVTLVWPDDNYGYIQRLDNEAESRRTGGSGVYYHLSYWGRPHDYLWLSTTSPALIQEEMTKAYTLQARNIWVANVGDIKPAEYNIQLFMDMAYHIQPFYQSEYTKTHLQQWVAANIDRPNAATVTNILWKYYQLAFERKPEFMGWSQTEPTTPVKFTAYNATAFSDQAQQRIAAYTKLEESVKAIKPHISVDRQDSYYQLVYYPVVAASCMNKKFLYRDKAYLYAQQGRLSTRTYDSLSKAAYQQIVNETAYYNTQLAVGKWAHIMSMNPRNLPVYQMPELNHTIVHHSTALQVLPEGANTDSLNHHQPASLPMFDKWVKQVHFIDLFLSKDTIVNYTVKTSAPWIKVSKRNGTLLPQGNASECHLWVDVDWQAVPAAANLNGTITISDSRQVVSTIAVQARNLQTPELSNYKGFAEHDGYISIYAKNYQAIQQSGNQHWKLITSPSATEQSVQALPLQFNAAGMENMSEAAIKSRPVVAYNFYTFDSSPAEVKVYTLPTFPLNKNFKMRYAVSVDDGPVSIFDFKTVGRSEEWKQNVLSNSTMRSMHISALKLGKHVLRIYMIDPGVVLDRILINLNNSKPFYGLLPETRLK